MPCLHKIGSVKIEVYGRDHLPPHFHAIYGDERVLIEIETLHVYAGYIPDKQLKKVISWAKEEGNKEKLMAVFEEWNPRHFK